MYSHSPLTSRVKALKSIFGTGRCTHLLHSPLWWRSLSIFLGPDDYLPSQLTFRVNELKSIFRADRLLTFSTHLQGEGTRVYLWDWEMYLPSPLTSRVKMLGSIFGTGRCTYLLHSPPGWRHSGLSLGPGDVLTFFTHLQGEGTQVYLWHQEMYWPSPLTSRMKALKSIFGTGRCTHLLHSAPGCMYSGLLVLGAVLTISTQCEGGCAQVYLWDWEMYSPSPLTSRVNALESIFSTGRCTYLLHSLPEWTRPGLSSGPGDGFARRRVRSECCSCRAASPLAVRRWTVWVSWREGWATGPGPRRTGRSHQQQTPTNTWVSPMSPFALTISVKADTSDQSGHGTRFWSELEGHYWRKHCRSTDAVLTPSHSVNGP